MPRCCEVHGVDARKARRPVSPAGRTDGEIARALLLDAGVSARADRRARRRRPRCLLPRRTRSLRPRICRIPCSRASRELLEWLSGRDGRGARAADRQLRGGRAAEARLRRASARFFRPGQGALRLRRRGPRGAPGDRPPARRHRRRAATRAGTTIVIGDTPRDIACARADRGALHRGRDRPVRADELPAPTSSSATRPSSAVLEAELGRASAALSCGGRAS